MQKHEFVRFTCQDCDGCLLWLVKRGGRNSHDSYNKDFVTFYSRKIHKGKFIRFVYLYDEQWDGFRHIFKFTIFDLEEECSYTLWWVSFHTFLYKYKNHTHFPLIKNQSRVELETHLQIAYIPIISYTFL